MTERQNWNGVIGTMRRCDKQVADEGLFGLAAFFRGQRLYKEALTNDIGAPLSSPKPKSPSNQHNDTRRVEMPEIKQKPERGIVAAACRIGDLTISMPAPARHHDILWAMNSAGMDPHVADQGFLDHRGIFMTRKTAMIQAGNHQQISEEEFDPDGELFSEHLW